MEYLVIKYDRLMHHLDYDIRKSAVGIMNWFIDENNILNILLHIRGVNYVYRIHESETPEDLKLALTTQTQILGVLDIEQERDEEQTESISFDQLISAGVFR